MKEKTMDDDGEVEPSDHQVLLPNPNSSTDFQTAESLDPLLDEFLKNSTTSMTCTHTHTCNPPGPDDSTHTHMCYHTHTQVIAPEEEDDHSNNNKGSSSSLRPKKRPLGNKEAVRKYREKKKAREAHLEEEVKKLMFLNRQLERKLKDQAVLEAEVRRLRSFLEELRGKINGELEVSLLGNVRMMGSWGGSNCQPPVVDCRANQTTVVAGADGQTMETVDSLVSSASQAD